MLAIDSGHDCLAFVHAQILGVESRSGLDSASGCSSINTPLQILLLGVTCRSSDWPIRS